MNGPSLAYTSAGKGIVAENDGLFLHFISDFEGVDIKKYIKVTDSEGNVLAGTLKMAAGGLRAVFEPQTAFEKGQIYVLYILDGLTDKNGAAIEPVRVEFEYGSDQQTTSLELGADADATLKANGGNQGGDKFVTIGTTGAYQSLLRFKIPTDYFYGYYSSAKLYLETQLSEKSALQPTEGTQIKVNLCSNDIETAQLWDENAVTWANTKSDGSIPIRGIYAKSGGSDAVKSYTCPAQMQRAGESNEYGRYIVSIDVGDLLKLYKFNKTEEGKDYIYCTFRVYTSSGSCVFYSKENTDDVSPAKLILEYYNYPENANVAVKDAHIASYNSTVKQSNYGGSTQIQVNIYRNAFLQFDVTDYLSAGGLDLRKLSLYLNTTESFEETDLSNLPIVIVKAKDNNGNNTYGWEEGVENGAVPSEGGGITWADGVSGILANRTTLSNVEFSGYTTLNDMHVLKIEFSASYLTDGEYLQTDPTSGRTYITIGIIGSGKSYSIKFLTKEGGVGMKSFAPFVVLSDLPTASDDASGSEAEGVSDVYSYPSHTETYTPSALYGDEIIQDKNTALDYVDFYEFVKPIRLIRLNTGEKHLSAGAGVSVLSDGCDSFKFKVTATDVSEISVNGGCDSAIMFCHNNPNYLLNYI